MNETSVSLGALGFVYGPVLLWIVFLLVKVGLFLKERRTPAHMS